MESVSPRDFGRLEAKVAALTEDLTEVRADVKQLLTAVNGATTSWRTLLTLGSIVAGVTGFVTTLLSRFGVI